MGGADLSDPWQHTPQDVILKNMMMDNGHNDVRSRYSHQAVCPHFVEALEDFSRRNTGGKG